MFTGSLRAFDKTVRAGSIRKASEILGVAPSSVSRHIAILERQMGTALFYRRSSGIELTHAGRLVADFARSVLFDYDTLRTDLDDLRGTQRRLVKLALVESIARYGPIAAITSFLKTYETTSFDVCLMPAPQVIDVVLEGVYDVGITFCAGSHPAIQKLASVPEPIVLVVAAGHDLAAATEIRLHDLSQLPLALPASDFGVRRIFDRACEARGLRLTPVLSSNVFETLREFARLGAGAAVLPLRAAVAEDGLKTLKAIPLADDVFRQASIDIIVLRKRRLPRVVQAFVDRLIAQITAQL